MPPEAEMSVPDDSEPRCASLLKDIRKLLGISHAELSRLLGASLVSVVRWERGDNYPSPTTAARIRDLHTETRRGHRPEIQKALKAHIFASRGVRGPKDLPLFEQRAASPQIALTKKRQPPLITRLHDGAFWRDGIRVSRSILSDRKTPAPTPDGPIAQGISAGKNTYTYDAHTYHTKVPPQGIAEVVRQYLPEGGLILDPFAGSGMTGVAARALGCDVILNELSPAASFIADRFTSRVDPGLFGAAIKEICNSLTPLRKSLYKTTCRECERETELQYTVWSYRVACPSCDHEFTLWDHCRSYGRTVREHKILSEFPCARCKNTIRKSHLPRSTAVPVLVGYKCCKRVQVEHRPNAQDLALLESIQKSPPLAEGYYPTTPLPDGVNLNQPKRHGLTSIDRFYTPRNLAAMSHIWRQIHHVANTEVAAFLGFAFTSLYQRVTRLSEYRFWGGSGNTARFNVPYIFNEANVFVTFERKARTIRDHLEATAHHYAGRCLVRTGSATNLDFLPNDSVDLVFTDPPFGANINYSEMNILWEAWLNSFTDSHNEAIVNRFQDKDARKYGDLMRDSLRECYRVLRPSHWLLLVFMNSSEQVWSQLRRAITESGFEIARIDIFDKQHGTFKQFVSDNTAGCDLILHCRKGAVPNMQVGKRKVRTVDSEIADFLRARNDSLPRLPYLHVDRDEEIDFRLLYSQWLSERLLATSDVVDFATFRTKVTEEIQNAHRQRRASK